MLGFVNEYYLFKVFLSAFALSYLLLWDLYYMLFSIEKSLDSIDNESNKNL